MRCWRRSGRPWTRRARNGCGTTCAVPASMPRSRRSTVVTTTRRCIGLVGSVVRPRRSSAPVCTVVPAGWCRSEHAKAARRWGTQWTGGFRWGLLQFLARLAQQPAGDDELLDLLRAFEDVQDLRVTRPLLQQRLLGVAEGAGELDAFERDVHDRATRLGLGHRR